MITISIGGLIASISSIICAVFSGFILMLITQRRNREEERHNRRVEIGVAERELLLSIAGATEILLRKINEEDLNGDVKKAEQDLVDKKRLLQKITYLDFFDGMESK